ncbi:MAG: RHS repeat domain-containing protein [Candidatus Binatia bacterium]
MACGHYLFRRRRHHRIFFYSKDEKVIANGNLVEQTAKATGDRTVYTYNVENQLVRVEKFTVAGGLSSVLTAEYRYDALGRRIEKNVNGVITRYVYDNEDILVELDSTNAVVARYTHGPGIDEPLIMLRGGQSFFYHADGLGSAWDLTDATGAIARSYTYDSFGQLLVQSGSLANPFTYTSREFDPETGLYHYRTRTYNPTEGRFAQEDRLLLSLLSSATTISDLPVGLAAHILRVLQRDPQDLHPYVYVNNNPTNRIDPMGLLSARCAAQQTGTFFKCFAQKIFAPTPPGIGVPETIIFCAACVSLLVSQAYVPAVFPCGACAVNLGLDVIAAIECIRQVAATPCDGCD